MNEPGGSDVGSGLAILVSFIWGGSVGSSVAIALSKASGSVILLEEATNSGVVSLVKRGVGGGGLGVFFARRFLRYGGIEVLRRAIVFVGDGMSSSSSDSGSEPLWILFAAGVSPLRSSSLFVSWGRFSVRRAVVEGIGSIMCLTICALLLFYIYRIVWSGPMF